MLRIIQALSFAEAITLTVIGALLAHQIILTPVLRKMLLMTVVIIAAIIRLTQRRVIEFAIQE
tara:strand:- start:153 stop:341 length:189 start_codon:yes stop_codon:yes gene_type:complete